MRPQFQRFLEGHGQTLRQMCQVPAFGRLDPFKLAEKMEMRVIMLSPECGVPSDICEQLLGNDARFWSAGTLHLPCGGKLVIMNPTHEIQRQRSSLMEEISHIHLKHRPSQLTQVGGIMLRSWNKSIETQAYWLGATALVPERILKGARTLGKTKEDVAEEHGVSIDLVRFRTKTLKIQLNDRQEATLF